MMQDRYEAKLRFATAFVSLVASQPPDKVTIGQIVEQAGKNRKTFYYHFEDKSALVRWLFRYDIACELERYFPPEELVFEAAGDNEHLAGLPFYARHNRQDGTIDNTMFFEVFSRSLEKHRDYYHQVFSHVGGDSLDNYLHQIYTPCLREDVLYLIDRELGMRGGVDAPSIKREMEGSAAVDFLAEFFTGSFISRVIMRIHDTGFNRSMYDIAPFENVIHESLQLMIAKHLGPTEP
ncbi:MAG: TetR family transcriptional regulator [Coriobacteriales bacterium]